VAMISIPRFQAPRLALPNLRALLLNRYVGLAGAAVLLTAAAAGVALSLRGSHVEPGVVRVSLADTFARAPHGWRQTLHPASGHLVVSEDVVRLSVRPIALSGGASWSRPGAVNAPAPLAVGARLPAAPIAGFFAPGPGGPLPIIAQDGRLPLDAYRRPFLSNGRPKVALVLGGLGLNTRLTTQAIETLPGEITLSFVAYAEGLQGWIDMARAHGHEVLIETPMEPVDYPDNDPGPYTLMSDAQPPDTVKKLEWVLSRATGYFGMTNYLGSRFLSVDSAYNTLATVAKGRGLAFIDDGLAGRKMGGGIARASAERVIDEQLSRPAIDQQLVQLETSAGKSGQALGSAFAYPVTLETVALWARSVDQRGLQLAPASALLHR
jgi:uncharacterized protein